VRKQNGHESATPESNPNFSTKASQKTRRSAIRRVTITRTPVQPAGRRASAATARESWDRESAEARGFRNPARRRRADFPRQG
jgi:hypothetical protein